MDLIQVIMQVFFAALATVCFALLFGVPTRYYCSCGLIGGIGWLIFILVKLHASTAVAIFTAMFTVTILSRSFAVLKRCPTTIFLTSGLIPLVPGADTYRAAYYMVNGNFDLACQKAFDAVKVAVAIMLGIVLAFEIPEKLFHMGLKKIKKEYQKHDDH